MYFRFNCAERNLEQQRAEASIVIGADHDRNMDTLQVYFTARLRSRQPGPDEIDYMASRMQQCPASGNLLKS
jgi:hypothetical protein